MEHILEKMKQLETIVSNKMQRRGLRCKFWSKGETFRLYLYSDALYDTKKCKQSAYIDLKRYCGRVTTECPSQPKEWCEAQSKEVEKHLESWGRYTRFVAYKLGIIGEQKAVQDAQKRIDETSPLVKGYFLEWRSVRVPINRYGKLATRNRQYIHVWEGYANLAPQGFVELSDAEYEVAKTKAGKMIEPYTTPKFS